MGIRSLEFESQFILQPDDCIDTSSPFLDHRDSSISMAGRGRSLKRVEEELL